MDIGDLVNIKKQYPNQKSSTFSNLFFCWSLPLFYKRYKSEQIEEEQYWPSNSHKSSKLGNRIETVWQTEISSTENNPSLWRTLWQTFKWEFLIFASLFFFSEFILKMSQPWLIGQLITQYSPANNTATSKNSTYYYSALLILSNFMSVMISHFYLLNIQHLGMKVRIACCSLIYRKTLKLNKSTLDGANIGKMVNLLTNDVNRLDLAPMYLLQLVLAPLETIFAIWCLYVTVGSTAISGIVFLLLFLPIQMYMGKLASSYRSKIASKTDERVKIINEIIKGIHVIKLYTWEKFFLELIEKTRKLELRQILRTSYLKAFNVSSMLFLNRTGIFLCILTYVLMEKQIDAKYVFVVSSFYAILRQTLTVYFPYGINNFSETRISVERIRKFLLNMEVPSKSPTMEETVYVPNQTNGSLAVDYRSPLQETLAEGQKPSVCLRDVSVKLTPTSENILENINFELSPNDLVAIIGTVGSGKSTLLYTILKELHIVQGEVDIEGSISYASQEPWLFSGTIRQNILFGNEYNQERYQEVIEHCGLKDDFTLFPHGDETKVGERGSLLSGGQKSRINLARAIYKDADIYLLDNPLASVDTKVGKQIFQNCVLKHLKNKCVVLVTHQLQYLGYVDKIYKMEKGKLQIDNTSYDFDLDVANTIEIEEKGEMKSNSTKIKEGTEERKTGTISKQVYRKYLQEGGNYCSLFFLAILFILTQAGASGADYFLAFWVNLQSSSKIFTNETCTYIYIGIIVFTIVITITRSINFYQFCIRASRNLHNNMTSSIISAPIQFFTINTSGMILNRFSKDMGMVDEILPSVIMDTLQIALIVIGSTLLITILNPWMIFPTVIMLTVFYFIRMIFLVTSRNLKRLEATNRSPVYSHITSTFQGLITIRSSKVESIIKQQFDELQDQHTSAFFMFMICNRAFAFWLDLICVFYIMVVVVSIIFIDTLAGSVGLVTTQSMNLIGVFQWGIRQWSELENQMINVERLVEYTEIIPEKSGEKEPPENWPKEGKIEFDSVSLQFSLNDLFILDSITASVKASEKIGIVGRTGAGKSSIISIFSRLIPHNSGRILVDDENIAEIPLHVWRKKISIIPQDPNIFSLTLRQNLDPYNHHKDEKLWTVLEQVGIKNAVLNLPEGLCSQASTNFSVGQKQQLCIARGMLKQSKILILDEATAYIDTKTEATILNAIKEQFKNSTIVTVAHRLHNIMVSDRVLVMDAGRMVEFDHPYLLLQNSDSVFSQLVNENQTEVIDDLTNLARKAYEDKNGDSLPSL